MPWYYWIALIALAVCLAGFAWHFLRLVRLGKPKDHSRPAGKPAAGIVYSFTAGMNPVNKESAFLHLPTYTAGVIFHIASFVSLLVFILFLFGIQPQPVLSNVLAFIAAAGAVSGLAMLIKRIADKKLRILSSPDDYFSNAIVSLFQALTALVLVTGQYVPAWMLVSALLLLYMPVGKLKHAIYFFAARYHLGLFYGWRNVWPPPKA